MKNILHTALLSAAALALLSATALAQTAPTDTTQTDQSEEDWRKSRKKSGSDDILDIFKNPNSIGVGNGRTYKPVDALPESSRRHLMRERAKKMAEAGVGEPVNTDYTPSEAAKSDPDLKADEQAAWSDMVAEMNGGGAPTDSAQNSAAQPASDQNGRSAGSADQNQDQNPSNGRQPSTPSVMRGGSAASVSDILSQIKGRSRAAAGIASGIPSGLPASTNVGTSPSGENNDTPQSGQNAGTDQNTALRSPSSQRAETSGASTSISDNAPAASDASANAAAQTAKATAAEQAKSEAQTANATQTAADTQAADNIRSPETISPLDRLKQNRQDSPATGKRSSASDYLKKRD